MASGRSGQHMGKPVPQRKPLPNSRYHNTKQVRSDDHALQNKHSHICPHRDHADVRESQRSPLHRDRIDLAVVGRRNANVALSDPKYTYGVSSDGDQGSADGRTESEASISPVRRGTYTVGNIDTDHAICSVQSIGNIDEKDQDELNRRSGSIEEEEFTSTTDADRVVISENVAASKIQRWFRDNIVARRKSRESVKEQVGQMLRAKRTELTQRAQSVSKTERIGKRPKRKSRVTANRSRVDSKGGHKADFLSADLINAQSSVSQITKLAEDTESSVRSKHLLDTSLNRMKAGALRRAAMRAGDGAVGIPANVEQAPATVASKRSDAQSHGAISRSEMYVTKGSQSKGDSMRDQANESTDYATDSSRAQALMAFLDEVDSKSQNVDQGIIKTKDSDIKQQTDMDYGQESLESHAATANTVTSTIVQQKLEIAEKEREIEKLKNDLEYLRDKHDTDESKTISVAALEGQVNECNATINRHLKFIDRLISDKKELSRRCEALLQQMKAADKKYTDKLEALTKGRKSDLKKQKERIMATEKVRREKWIREQTVKIKDMTVKGLEPEIKRLVAEHKEELQRIKQSQFGGLQEHIEEINAKHALEIKSIRSEHQNALANGIAAERNRCVEKFQEDAKKEERQFHEERRKLQAEIQNERQRATVSIAEERASLAAELAEARELEGKATDAARQDTERVLQEAARRHEEEKKRLTEQLQIEKESWEDMYLRRQEAQVKAKEAKIREQLRKERDEQIAVVIERLEEEAQANQVSNDEQFNIRLHRIQEKLNMQLADAEQSEQACLAKYNDARMRLVQTNEELATLRGTLAQRDQDLASTEEAVSRLSKERGSVAEIVKREFQDTMAANEAEISSLRRDLNELRESSRLEISKLKESKDYELDSLHKRVQSTIQKKDETISALRDQLESTSRRADHLEELLNSQKAHIN